ncbi:exosome complex exonuclease RRP6-like protein [Phytophthora infestans T30-4]|uniref:Exosome complex exonuclease RRP6-like protein n=2 Tax=Phytophthora infestans TaxID=4787 RepID=D0MWN1_PHYIT|nr:exosome complex exonuclease RRP6-like protein [Phytophthora infestans T30-4]EEY64044.1 exosome complex exonuclease RRP6-like protein [Phytophthora infestans T30-4]|eukprot:XP_002907480.1 exosome complex exonuclease RRP6-like protein [Phytophthora infestans T30-4]
MAEELDAAAFVSALYRKVLLSVKASNAIPSEDDGFHFHSQFSTEFATRSKRSGAKAKELVQLLTKRRRADADAEHADSSDEDEDEVQELFDGPEPNARVTDYADMLLDEASKHLARFVSGESAASTEDSKLRPLENTPHVFEKNKKANKEEEVEKKVLRGAQDKPQDRFDEKIDNSDAPFVSKLREKVHALINGAATVVADDEDDEMAPRNPYYPEIKGLKYAPWQLEASEEPYEMIGLDKVSYLWVDSEENLMQMMKSLTAAEARVIAVDLEHHSYRSYMGLTCLMQISTAQEDFLVDTLALRGKLQTLNQVFCDPEKVKVLHGSDMDILWLQRDLGLYIVNLFDTGRAARLLQYPRFSLAYMLKRHCNIDADKQYQLADWRTRPLDKNMVKYAREDTRYLLFIYDRLKKELLQAGAKSRESLLFQTLQNSSKLCLQVYEKPQPTEEDALAVGEKLKGTVYLRDLSALQKRVIVALYLWRDRVARQEDESVAYVMPNHVLMKLTKHLPVRSDDLFRVCHPVPLLIRKHALQITKMIVAEKTKLAAEETKTRPEPQPAVAARPTRKTWNEDGDEQSVTSIRKRVGRTEYAPWKSGQRKAGVAAEASSSSNRPVALGANTTETVDESETAATLLEKVNAMVASTTFTIADSEAVETAVAKPTSLLATPSKEEGESKPKMPQSISETYNMSSRSKRRKTTAVDTLSASEVKDRAQAFMQKVDGDDEGEDESGFQGFDYAAASTKDDNQDQRGRRGGRGGRGNKRQAGYNPFVAMSGKGKKDPNEPKAAQVKKMHHMPRSATFVVKRQFIRTDLLKNFSAILENKPSSGRDLSMTRSDTLKRVSPTSFESDGGEGTAKKSKALVDVANAAAATVRKGPLKTEDMGQDSIEAGEDAQTSALSSKTDLNREQEDGGKDVEMADVEASDTTEIKTDRNTAANKSSSKKLAKKRAKPAGKAASNGKTATKTKAKPKPKSKPKAKAKAAPKRKPRTQTDKMKENAPLASPLFVETGAEWNNTNIDFDELNTLRSMWELPAACHILWLLQSPLTLRFSNTLLEYEAALLRPEDSPVLEDVFTKLLLKKSERACLSAGIGLKYEWWNKQLRIYYLDMYNKWYALLRKAGERLPESFSQDEDDDDSSVSDSRTDEQVDVELSDDEWLTLDILKARLETLGVVCPLKHQSFADLSIELRCKILLNLCEAVVDDPANTEYMRQMEEDDLRVDPLGNDRAGNLYYFFPQFYEERRLYRLEPETRQWSLWAKGDDACRSMLKAIKDIRGRKIRGEQELLDHLEVIVEQIEDEDEARARQLEKANRLAILEAIPRKRSLRLQVKQLEKMEKHQEELEHQKELSMEEIAEMRRDELLKKVEREAEKETRDAEREARRLHREQVEREEAQAERERRRLRRIEKEQEDEKLEQLAEEERRKQEDARALRAQQRNADEEWQQVDQEAGEAATTTRSEQVSASVEP